MKKRFLAILLCLCMVVALLPTMAFAAGSSVYSSESDVPAATVTYSSEQTEPIVISESTSVKLSGVNILVGAESENTSAIKICNNSNVDLIFEGGNTLSGNAALIGAGIYVEEGSIVTIYGLEGSSLTVTGGKYSAGIGGIGYPSAGVNNPKAGTVNIKSGNIIATGGARGAGIGSGCYSSATEINIDGGSITAIGSENSAGIGSGYGTSGGTFVDGNGNPTASGVGFYNGGDITISGGTVCAASYAIDFSYLNPYDTQTLYEDAQGSSYSTSSFAAGIGGGYGASSGNIIINGSADVTAVGGCGGAGIGSGRGTSNTLKYDAGNFISNITIGGNAKVVAMATDDTRNSQGGGAAIGTGRGCDTAGTIKILDSANVLAVASPYAAAIGGSWKVGLLPFTSGVLNENASEMNALPESLKIGSGATVCAVSDGYRSAISFPESSEKLSAAHLLSLNIDEGLLTKDSYPARVNVLDESSGNGLAAFALYAKKGNVMLHIPDADVVRLRIGNTASRLHLLTNDAETPWLHQIDDAQAVSTYSVSRAKNLWNITVTDSIAQNNPTTNVVVDGADFAYTLPSRSGYSVSDVLLDGISVLSSVSGNVFTLANVAQDHALDIKYKAVYSGDSAAYYTLTFDTNGGSRISSIRPSEYTTVDLSKYIPTREGYTFTGWYSDEALTTKITSIKLTKNATIYAGWEWNNPFTDVSKTDWFYEDVAKIFALGLMQGTNDTAFVPHATTTRGMIVTILYRLESEPAVTGTCPFTDVKSGSYYEKAITWAAEKGIVGGYGNGNFGPDDAITREQLATILYNYAKFKGYDVSVGEDTNILSYNDALDLSEFAISAVQWACGAGIIHGDAGNLMPKDGATRAQAATMLIRFLENADKQTR